MKSILLVSMLLACFVANTFAAAVEPLEVPAEKAIEDESTTEINTECYQPKEIGRCFAIFTRYAFNAENHSCEEFIYGGCSGNSNNFETKEECEVKCLHKINTSTDTALLEPEETTTFTSTTASVA